MSVRTRQDVVGEPLPRVEDVRLLTGRGTYVDDLRRPDMLFAAFARSETAHGLLGEVDVGPALEVPGVVAVLVAGDLAGEVSPIRSTMSHPDFKPADTPILAEDRVRFVGEPIAIVVATTAYIAEDGAEAVSVNITPLEPVTSIEAALAPGAPLLHDVVPGNVWVTFSYADDEVETALAAAPHKLELETRMQRVSPHPLEPRAILADLSVPGGTGTIWVTSQGPHFLRTGFARSLRMGESELRLISPDVGGGFGAKLPLYPEYVAVAAASRRLRRPIKWSADRREELLTCAQAREQVHRVAVGFDDDGMLLAARLDVSADAGSYSVWPETSALEGIDSFECFPGAYVVPHVSATVISVATNKAAVGPYRGVGRTMTCMTLERMMDRIAAELDLDPLEVRRRNIGRTYPHALPSGIEVENASFAESLDTIEEVLDLAALRREHATFRTETVVRGVGIAVAIEPAAPGRAMGEFGSDIMIGFETALVRVETDGKVAVAVGTHSHGQGHETTMAQLAADALQIAVEDVVVRLGDTELVPYGGGTWASRSAVIGGGAVIGACRKVLAKAREIAATMLDTEPHAVAYEDGAFSVGGRAVGWADLAYRANLGAHLLPEDVEPGLEAMYRYFGPSGGTVSNRVHAVVVEVDLEIGAVSLLRYVAVEDCGPAINPLIVAGQIHGGVAQGIGNAMYEQLSFDANGQPLTTTLLDYLLPTADSIPPIEVYRLETPLESTVYGIKGVGEGGAIPGPAVILNAVNDALAPLGASLDQTPITPDAIFSALTAAAADA